MTNIDLMMSDVKTLLVAERLHGKFDTVVMNPPFGTKHNQGIIVYNSFLSLMYKTLIQPEDQTVCKIVL